jgi:dinuclear metal center YbgI/SA1388 family protein
MVLLSGICRFLNELLQLKDVSDPSNNGLQVGVEQEVYKVAFAVDACIEAFEQAKKQGANLIIVHHGISWGDSLKYITGLNYTRIKWLIQNNMSLYAAHLPLDKHQDFGNNVQLFKLLQLRNTKPFGSYDGQSIGFKGEFEKEKTVDELADFLESKLSTKCRVLKFGKVELKTAAVVSGGGGEDIAEAITEGIDVFITGEVTHSCYQRAKDGKLNIIAAGHYATETVGLKALMPAVHQKFNIPTIFIEADTGM